MTRARDVADTQDNLGGAVPPVTTGKNFCINGGFDIWQRGTTSTSANGYVTADRWGIFAGTAPNTAQETTIIPPGLRYSFRATTTASSTQPIIYQAIETANAIQLAGQSINLSGYVASSTSATMNIDVQFSTSVDNSTGGSWTTISPTSGGSVVTNASTMTRCTGVYAIPSNARTLLIRVYPNSVIASGASVYVGGVQLELGSVATPFSRAGGTIQGELAACQRYYQRFTSGSLYGTMANVGYANSSTIWYGNIQLIVPMRVAPTSLDQGGSFRLTNGPGYTVGTLTLTAGVNSPTNAQIGGTASGMTTYHYVYLQGSNDAAAYIGLSAEL